MLKLTMTLLLLMTIFTGGYSQGEIYLKIDGIDGTVTKRGFERCIKLSGLEQRMSNPSSRAITGKPPLSNIRVKKMVDKTSPVFMMYGVSGRHVRQARIIYTGFNGADDYTIILTDVYIDSIAVLSECKADCITSEELSISFDKMQCEYRNANGSIIRSYVALNETINK